MEKSNINIHDCIEIVKVHTDPARSYYNGTHHGIVIATGDALVIKDCRGTEESHDDKDYTYTYSKYSEIQFLAEIKKAIEREEKELEEKMSNLDDMREWQQAVKFDITLLGKLRSFLNQIT